MIVRLLTLSEPSVVMSRIDLCFMREGMWLWILLTILSSPWPLAFIWSWEQPMIDAFVVLNQSKVDLCTRSFWFCVGWAILNLLNAEIHDGGKLEALMRLNTEIHARNFAPSWFKPFVAFIVSCLLADLCTGFLGMYLSGVLWLGLGFELCSSLWIS